MRLGLLRGLVRALLDFEGGRLQLEGPLAEEVGKMVAGLGGVSRLVLGVFQSSVECLEMAASF